MPKRILVVDDDADLVRILSSELLHAGYEVLSATSGQEAMRICESEKQPIDLLITDLIMKPMNGPDLAELLLRICPGVKVIYISGYSERFIRENVSAHIEFLNKPVLTTTLISTVNRILSE